MALEELEKKLYQEVPKKQKVSPPAAPQTETKEIPLKTGWSEEEPKPQKKTWKFFTRFTQMSRRLFWILIIIVFVLLVLAGFYFYQYFTTREIIFSLKAPANTLLAVPFDIEVNVQNQSANPLKDTKLSMILPEGAVSVKEGPGKRTLNLSFGDLEKNSSLQEKIPVIIFSNEQSVKRFELTLSYFPPALGPTSRFEETKSIEVVSQEPAIKLDLVAPQKVLNNEDFELEVDYQNISETDFSGVELELNYPEFFTFKNANPAPSQGNNLWLIGDLAKKSDKKIITIKGSVLSSEESFFEIKGSLRVGSFGQKYLINQKAVTLNIAASPLSLNITLNDQLNYLAILSDRLKYKINYRNNSEVGLNDVVIKATVAGEMFDFGTLYTAGFFDSKNNVITWNVANTPNLRLIPPSGEGNVEFEIQTKSSYPIKRLSDKNFILGVSAEISSPTVPYYVASEKTIGIKEFKTKVAGKISIGIRAFFNEPDPNFSNKGFFPPKVNQPTNFTIHWIITNYSTDVKNIEVKGYLQSGVKWTGQVKSNINSPPTYNERTQEVSWLIDKIIATKGVISKPVEAIFQVEATPNVTQINQPMPLLSETSIKGIDEFTNLELKDSAQALNSQVNVTP